jgi:Carboxypeptidase regulatory-like domain/TonB dependent receptor
MITPPWSLVVASLLATHAVVAAPVTAMAAQTTPIPAQPPAIVQLPTAPVDPSDSGQVVVTIVVEGLRIPAVNVELLNVDDNIVIAQTMSDSVGQVTFPDVPQGRYLVRAVRDGFADAESTRFTVAAGSTAQVLVEMRLTFVRESVDVVAPANSPTESLQPVAVSDVLSGAKMDVQPLAGDDFQSLLTVLPSIIRGPDGRLRVKGGGPTTGALQVSSASLNDPSTGDFDLELPSGAVESVEVLSNPFAAEYGRFSTSVTQVRTRRGTNEWVVKPDNLVPGFGKGFGFINKFEPRLSLSGPIKRDRLLFGQYFQYRFARTEVRSLPDRPLLGLESFDSFTRLDAVLSPRHALTGGLIYFPRKITNATLSTFRPPETTTKFTQEGLSAGVADRLVLSASTVLETTFAVRAFQVEQKPMGSLPMFYAPQGQSGSFFSDQERSVNSEQFVQSLTVSKDGWVGQHIFKFGLDIQHSRFDGIDANREVQVLRLDGSLAERTTFVSPLVEPDASALEVSVFAQDRWRVTNRLNVELGFRIDRDGVIDRLNYSPRVGLSMSLLPEGRGILRGGIGKFAERTQLTVNAFTQYSARTVQRFGLDGTPVRSPVTFVHTMPDPLRTPESIVQTVAWDQRVGRRFFLKAAYLRRNGVRAYVLNPDADLGLLSLSSSGASRYWEVETTGRWLASEHRDLSVAYVRSRSTRELNDYDQFFGNFRNPIIRPNEDSLSPTDVTNRVIVRGSIGLLAQWVFTPIYEWRTGFPWSAVDEFQDFVGTRNRAGRLPSVSTLDFTIARPMHFRKYRFTAGIKVYNAFDSGSERDVQNNITSPDYGTFYNPIQRSIGFLISTSRP